MVFSHGYNWHLTGHTSQQIITDIRALSCRVDMNWHYYNDDYNDYYNDDYYYDYNDDYNDD